MVLRGVEETHLFIIFSCSSNSHVDMNTEEGESLWGQTQTQKNLYTLCYCATGAQFLLFHFQHESIIPLGQTATVWEEYSLYTAEAEKPNCEMPFP